jgi:hypothetical protein
MKKVFFIGAALIFSYSNMHASVFKGQRAYMKLCKKCHKSGGMLSGAHTQEEWDEYFDDDAKKLKAIHKDNAAAMRKLESKKFKKNLKHMRQFFHKYAADSGNVPACN